MSEICLVGLLLAEKKLPTTNNNNNNNISYDNNSNSNNNNMRDVALTVQPQSSDAFNCSMLTLVKKSYLYLSAGVLRRHEH